MATAPATVDAPPDFRDRKTGLVIFGILTILLGGLCALGLVDLRFAKLLPADFAPLEVQRLLPDPMDLGVLAAVLVGLGLGSIMARRWARALLLIFSSWWLAAGLLTMDLQAWVLPGVLHTFRDVAVDLRSYPDEAQVRALLDSYAHFLIVSGLVFVVLPGAWVLFYRSRHVKATCERRDPVACWTDRCPLPVLAAGVWLVFSAATLLWAAATDQSPLPFFGTFVTGAWLPVLDILLALLGTYAAWALYRLQWRGWWIVALTLGVATVSVFVTFSRHDTFEALNLAPLAQRADHPGPDAARLEREAHLADGSPAPMLGETLRSPPFHGHEIAWLSLVGMLPLLGYVVYLRRFFPRAPSQLPRAGSGP